MMKYTFDELDTGSFKAFWAASEELHFTNAARVAGLTQSGISQHIARLEKQLGVALFHRVNKAVQLTEAGRLLREHIKKYLEWTQELRTSLTAQAIELEGLVSYAMPWSCLLSPHFGMLLEVRAREFEKVKLNVTLCTNEEVISKVLSNEIDFGFITKATSVSGVQLTLFCQEQYVLIGPTAKSVDDISAKRLQREMFIAYPGVDVLFNFWSQNRFSKNELIWESLAVSGSMNSLEGAIKMVEGGMGLTVLPFHCVETQIKNKKIFCSPVDLGPDKVKNNISIVYLKNVGLPLRVRKVIDTFLAMHPKQTRSKK